MNDRRDDWARGVDENLASLNAGQRIWEREVNALHKAIAEQDNLLRGDTEKDTDGLIARLHKAENEVLLLKAILLKDAAGGRGLVAEVESLKYKEKSLVYRWQFWIALLGLIGTIATAIIMNIDKIEKFIQRQTQLTPLQVKIERAKHPKPRNRHYTINVSTDGQTTTTSP